jgi:hypothetical protein
MKKLSVLTLLCCAAAFADSGPVAHWRGIEGVVTAPGVDNPVGQAHSGAGPWTTQSGNARINLTTGEGSFDVEGLVLNGGNSSGTPGAVAAVVGTLVCNAGGAPVPEVLTDTPSTPLNAQGNAELSFKINVPLTCNNPLFLIRVLSGRWIATGTIRTISTSQSY